MPIHTPSKEGGREGSVEGRRGATSEPHKKWKDKRVWYHRRTDRQLPKMQKMPMAMHTPSKVSLLTVVEDQNRRPAQAIRQTAQTFSKVPWNEERKKGRKECQGSLN